ncbi:MAG: phage baseplate assembly protein V [Terriglobia bacterium]
MSAQRFFGKYRGTVVNNVDPTNIGRLQVMVPDVLGPTLSSWAMPCFAVTGQQMGVWVLPQIGAGVWVEFEQGDPDYPIWAGCWFGAASEVPALALAAPPAVPNFVIQTQGQNTIMISDLPGPTGGILLKTVSGAMISINDTGIIISNGKGAAVMLTGPTVNINNGALTIV